MDASLFDFSVTPANNTKNSANKQKAKTRTPPKTTHEQPKTTHMQVIIEEKSNPPAPNICIDNFSAPTAICIDTSNNIIEKESNNIPIVNIIDDESYNETSNNYYDNIDNKI